MLEGTYMVYDSIVVTLILVVDAIGLYFLRKEEMRKQQRRMRRVVNSMLKELHYGKRTHTR